IFEIFPRDALHPLLKARAPIGAGGVPCARILSRREAGGIMSRNERKAPEEMVAEISFDDLSDYEEDLAEFGDDAKGDDELHARRRRASRRRRRQTQNDDRVTDAWESYLGMRARVRTGTTNVVDE